MDFLPTRSLLKHPTNHPFILQFKNKNPSTSSKTEEKQAEAEGKKEEE